MLTILIKEARLIDLGADPCVGRPTAGTRPTSVVEHLSVHRRFTLQRVGVCLDNDGVTG
jgi:hypothetical protein